MTRTVPSSLSVERRRLSTTRRGDEVRCQLEAMARRLGPGGKFPRVSDICRDMAISASTLDGVMSDLEARGLVERRKAVGIFVTEEVPRQVRHFAIVCDPRFFHSSGASPVWGQLMQLLSEEAAAHDPTFDCYFCRVREGDAPFAPEVADAFERGEVDGVLGIVLPNAVAEWLLERRVPLVNLFGPGNVVVGTDLPLQIELCVRGLAARGCRRLEIWSSISPQAVNKGVQIRRNLQQLQTAFERALQLHNLPTGQVRAESHWLEAPLESIPTPAQQGYDRAKTVFSQPREMWPDGVVLPDDMQAQGVLTALRQLGLEPGREVQIATHANSGSPVLTGETNIVLSEVSPHEIALAMWSALESLVATWPRPVGEHLILSPRLRDAATAA